MPGSGFYEVERLVSKRKCANNRVEYLVRWKGYSRKYDTWEPLSNLNTCMDLVQAFNASKRRTRPSFHAGSDTAIRKAVRKRNKERLANKTRPVMPAQETNSRKLGRNGGVDDEQRSKDSALKRRAPRMLAPLLSKKAKTFSQRKGHALPPSPRSPRRRAAVVNITPISARAFSSFVSKDREKLQNGFIHTSPPSSDHEYFSTPYKGRWASWREKRGETPSTSGSDDTDLVLKPEKEECNVIIDLEPAELPGMGYSSKSNYQFTQDGFAIPSESDSETLERKLTLRRGISRSKHLHVLRRGNCTEIILTNEAERNALTPETLDEFSRLLDHTATGPSTMVLFSAVGDFFCSGFDLKHLMRRLTSTANVSAVVKSFAASIRNFVNCLIDFPKPLVAMVQGPAIGLGCAILPHFDTVYSSDRAYYATPYTEMGQTPEACSSYLFPQIIGHSVANDMLLNGITLTAIEAKSLGLVSDVYLHDSLKRNVLPILKSLSVKSREALVATKELIRNPQRARLKYINQCEYIALKQRWEDKDALKYILQYTSTYNHIV